jgi:hypothetical protein
MHLECPMHLLILGASLAVAGGDPCPKPGQCFESSESKDFGAYVRSLDHMIDTLVAPADPIIQLGTGHTTVVRPDIPGSPGGPLGDVWTQKGGGPNHYIEHWFLDDPAGLPDPQDPFGFEFQQVILDEAEMASILDDQPGYEDDTYIRMDLHYMEIPDLVSTEDLDYVGDSVERHAFRGWRTDASGSQVVSCYLLRETHFDGNNAVERRLDHWVLYGDDVDTVLVENAGDSLDFEPLTGEPTPKTFYAWHQLNPNIEVKQAAVVEYVYGDIYDSPVFGP